MHIFLWVDFIVTCCMFLFFFTLSGLMFVPLSYKRRIVISFFHRLPLVTLFYFMRFLNENLIQPYKKGKKTSAFIFFIFNMSLQKIPPAIRSWVQCRALAESLCKPSACTSYEQVVIH